MSGKKLQQQNVKDTCNSLNTGMPLKPCEKINKQTGRLSVA